MRFQKTVAVTCAGLVALCAATPSYAWLPPPPPPPVHHVPMGGGGGGGGGIGPGAAAGLVGFMGICLLPFVLSQERKKRDIAWRNHVDVLPCGWDVIFASSGELRPAPAPVRRVHHVRHKRHVVCIKGGTAANGGCTRY